MTKFVKDRPDDGIYIFADCGNVTISLIDVCDVNEEFSITPEEAFIMGQTLMNVAQEAMEKLKDNNYD